MKASMLVGAVAVLLAGAATAEIAAPYSGWQTRDIKALSAQEVDDLRSGRGMSLALAAELNGYPGPRHVLDLGEALALTAEQRRAFETLFDEMEAEAQRLGAEIIQREADLDDTFRRREAAAPDLRARLAALGALKGELRYVHLRSHLTTKSLLSEAQVAHYNALRGYGGGTASGHPEGGHRHGPAPH
jgi:gas vesicle protein